MTTSAMSTSSGMSLENETMFPSFNNVVDVAMNVTDSVTNVTESILNITKPTTATVPQLSLQEQFRKVTYMYVLPVMYGFGILFNIVNIVVLNQKQMPESLYTYLSVIAVLDLGSCFWPLIYSTITRDLNSYSARVFDAYFLSPFINFCIDGSIWITCMMALERVLVVGRPLLARSICNKTRTRIGIVAILIYDALNNVPRFFIFRPAYDPNKDRHYATGTDFSKSQTYNVINWYYTVTINFIPLLTLIICNTAIIVLVRRAKKRRNELRSSSSTNAKKTEENKMTVTLIGIVCFSVICLFPPSFVYIQVAYFIFGRKEQTIQTFQKSPFYQMYADISNIFLALNFLLDTMVYSVFNKKFRRVLVALITGRCRH